MGNCCKKNPTLSTNNDKRKSNPESNETTEPFSIDSEYITNIIPESAKEFSLDGFVTSARIVRVVNGDSVHALFRFRGTHNTWKCRISGIDAPEPRGGTEESKQNGLKSKEYLEQWLLGKIVKIYCGGFEPFGRLLISIEYDGEDVGEALIENGYAIKYEKI